MRNTTVPDPSDFIRLHNRGCYENPFSGVGMEFSPLKDPDSSTPVILHECGYLPALDHWIFPNTLSPFWRLYFNSVPGHHVVMGTREIPLTPRHIVLIPEGQPFDCVGTGPVSHFWMTFSLAMKVMESGPLLIPATTARTSEIRRIARLFTGIGEGDRLAVQHRGLALLHGLTVEIRSKLQTLTKSNLLGTVIQQMRENLDRKCSIERIARDAGISRRTLHGLFHQQYNCPPLRFLTRLRVNEAARLLAYTELSLDEIAARSGLEDRYYLSRVFKKETGTPPASYRRKMTQPPA